jgi:hypothetical protein
VSLFQARFFLRVRAVSGVEPLQVAEHPPCLRRVARLRLQAALHRRAALVQHEEQQRRRLPQL